MEDGAYVVRATWDEDAKVWVAESEDVPGLVAEAPNVKDLIVKLRVLIPELLEANDALPPHFDRCVDVPIELQANYREHIRINA